MVPAAHARFDAERGGGGRVGAGIGLVKPLVVMS
jgi:hypothetical protein